MSRHNLSSCYRLLFLALVVSALSFAGCRSAKKGFVIALDADVNTLDPLRSTDAASERLRQLMFNTLMRKNERFEYVGEIAESFQASDDKLSVTYKLRDGVKFHNGKPLTSADVKYTLDTLTATDSPKAAGFFDGAKETRQPIVTSVEAPDARTVVLRLRRPWNEINQNAGVIPIIPEGSAAQQATQPLGSGAFKFVRRDTAQQVVDLEAFNEYWEGAPNIKSLRVRSISDANTMQAELRSGNIDLVSSAANLSSDSYKALSQDQNLKIEQFPGANVAYLAFNAQDERLKDPRLRRAIAHAIDRESLVRDLFSGQAAVAHSILPESSWAYATQQKYDYNPERAKQLIEEIKTLPGEKGAKIDLTKPFVFKISAASAATRQYAQVMQNQLRLVGVPVEIETLEQSTLQDAQRKGQFQITTGRWVGGNQDPVFLRDLFLTTGTFNRTKYSNPELDKILQEAVTTFDREKARSLYSQAQEIINRDVPMLPLWYPATMVVARKSVGNIKIDPSGDWSFVRQLTVAQN